MENYPGGRMPENQNSRTNDSMRPRPLNHEYSCANDVMRPVTQLNIFNVNSGNGTSASNFLLEQGRRCYNQAAWLMYGGADNSQSQEQEIIYLRSENARLKAIIETLQTNNRTMRGSNPEVMTSGIGEEEYEIPRSMGIHNLHAKAGAGVRHRNVDHLCPRPTRERTNIRGRHLPR